MRTISRFFIPIAIMIAAGTYAAHSVEAGVLAHQAKNIVFGEWQPPQASGGQGLFLALDSFTPGKTLALKILLEHPGDTVTVKLITEVPGKPKEELSKTVRDDSPNDLLPQQKAVIVVVLTTIPVEPVTKYTVEVQDKKEKKPVVQVLDNPAKPAGLFNRFGQAVSNTASTLWNLPGTIAETIFSRERKLIPFRTLVIANTEGETLNTLTIQQGTLASPIWLPNNHILFVETDSSGSILRIVPATFDRKLEDFGGTPLKGTEPHCAPRGKMIVFRQGTKILSANLAGTKIVPLIQDKDVDRILGVFPDAKAKTDNLIFTVKSPGTKIADQWLAKIQGTKVHSIARIPYDVHWLLLDQVRIYGKRMLYERQDTLNNRQNWNIYLSQSPQTEGIKITSDDINDRDPAWSPDGRKIVYVSE